MRKDLVFMLVWDVTSYAGLWMLTCDWMMLLTPKP
jgi:hypothetical protein